MSALPCSVVDDLFFTHVHFHNSRQHLMARDYHDRELAINDKLFSIKMGAEAPILLVFKFFPEVSVSAFDSAILSKSETQEALNMMIDHPVVIWIKYILQYSIVIIMIVRICNLKSIQFSCYKVIHDGYSGHFT